jgi:hypothetical protein
MVGLRGFQGRGKARNIVTMRGQVKYPVTLCACNNLIAFTSARVLFSPLIKTSPM